MKQKDRLVSSLIIALVAGFIYYAFGDSETIKRIPQFAYETVKSALLPEEAGSDNTPEFEKTKKLSLTEANDYTELIEKTPFNFEEAEFAQLPDLSMLIRLRGEGENAFLTNKQIEKLEKLKELENISVLPDDFMQYVGYIPDLEKLDSGRFKIRIKIDNMDSLNAYLDKSMMKLNESLSKLNEQLKSEDFLKNIPEIDNEDFKVEVNVDDINETVKESMKEFEENMKDFDFDMKEFKDSMKQFKESMKELKKNMKDLDSLKIKGIHNKIEVIES